MAKTKKVSKDLADDWIKQVVPGQRHKLAHMAEGAYVDKDKPEPETPAPEPVPAPEPATPRPIDAIPGDTGSTVYLLRNADRRNEEALKASGAYKNGGCVKRMEKGGEVDGPGTGTSDSVPAMLSDGEYVLPADTVKAVGKTTLDKLKNATHTPVDKPKMKGMVTMRADGGEIDEQTKADRNSILSGAGHLAAAAGDIASQPVSIVGSAYNNLIARPARAVGVPLPNTSWNVGNYGATPLTDYMYGADGRGPQPLAPAPTSATPTTPATPEPTPAPAAPAPASPAPAAANPITAPGMVQRPDLISEAERLVNTPGLGLAGLGLAKRVASGAGGERSAEISGQYGLQNTAMTANERLEQAKLVEYQRQQNLATWTPDKNMMGELLGYGRTKGGTPEYVTKESLMPKPAIAEGATGKDAHNRPVVYKNGTWVAKQ